MNQPFYIMAIMVVIILAVSIVLSTASAILGMRIEQMYKELEQMQEANGHHCEESL